MPPADRRPRRTGFVIVRLSVAVDLETATLRELAERQKLGGLRQVLERTGLESQRLVRSIKPEQLLALERRAEQSDLPPLHSLTAYWRIDARAAVDLDQLLADLSRLAEVDLAYAEEAPSDPGVTPDDDPFAGSQHYLEAAPTGIDARWVWATGMPGSDGAGVHFMDMERGWFLGHEDLPSPVLFHGDNEDGHNGYIGNHGTAVLGEVAGVDNTRGIIGIAPNVSSVRVSSYYDAATNTENHIAEAIAAAATASPRPDVLLLEIQLNYLPAETDPANFDAIRLAVASGIIVVEAGGNGNNNLDDWTDGFGFHRLERGSPDFRDSGAILVGAALSALPHDRWDFSNFGSRVDCYGWGENIVSAGYGDLATGGTDNTTYTQTFGGTSGASPIVSGAALLVQAMYQASSGSRLSPTQMRALLSNPANGTAQGGGVTGNIGVMPNLRTIVQAGLGLVPDVYVRDAVGDTGAVPSTGAVSVSPDVIVTPSPVADPQAAFGEGSGTENVDTLGEQVEHGQDNSVYVRMRNRGAAPATATTATVYWSEVATLVTPDMWHPIGTTAPIDVPVGDTLHVAGPLTWARADLPPTGDHACFVAILNQAADPAPPIPPAGPGFDWNAFVNFVRDWNNVTWRNFNVVDLLADPSADPIALDFLIAGSPDAARAFDFEIRQRLPRGVEAALEVPENLFGLLPKHGFLKVRPGGKGERPRLVLPFLRALPLCGVRLGGGARHRCRLLVRGSHGLAPGLYTLAMRQVYEGVEVGRVTWGLRVRKQGGPGPAKAR